MAVDRDAAGREWHLRNGRLSHLLRVLENGWLGSLHLGAPLAPGRSYRHLGVDPFPGFADQVGTPVGLVLPVPGRGDFRMPALVVELADGSTVLDPRVVGHRIVAGKPELPGLPSTYTEDPAEAETLVVTLRDEPSGVEVDVRTTLFRDVAAIARSLEIRNAGERPVVVRTAMSASVDLPDDDWWLVTFSGTWARERHPAASPLVPGRRSVGSLRGATGHEHNPFVILRRPETDETHGEALALSLVYSGNFLAEAEVDPYGTTRARIGIHPDGFAWALAPGGTFTTPEAVIAWSGAGLGELSHVLHELYGRRLARGPWRDRPRPILLNNWEATYFAFDEAKLLEIAAASRDLGVELLVLDDGWFGKRDDDTSSLGDWFVDRAKLPNGIDGLARAVEALGLRFGLWIEPEMVNERSELYRAHPDWVIGVPGRERTTSRHQLMLDLSRSEVVDHLEGVLAELLDSAPISYVKWDFNRFMTEPYSVALPPGRQGEFAHRYALGLYDLYRRLTTRFPDVLFESCAGGGGRFDPGLLAFAPQAWTSDDTDAVERLRIQWGSSFGYPISSMGAHVSAVPNHQVGRVTPLATRGAVAFFGAFGYELDPTRLTDDERAEVRAQIAWYRERRELLQFGRFLRLRDPFAGDGNEAAWMSIAPAGDHAVVGWYRILARPVPQRDRLRLRGLDPDADYAISVWPSPDGARGSEPDPVVLGGDELMAVGLPIEPPAPFAPLPAGDAIARLFELRRR
ncbi:MAG TPA: alpha-galactosidase [Candidatus Limnocylindrales bacterium]|nr:alpha-galactosidase [Candidatus Limnocylindrales bacterium]